MKRRRRISSGPFRGGTGHRAGYWPMRGEAPGTLATVAGAEQTTAGRALLAGESPTNWYRDNGIEHRRNFAARQPGQSACGAAEREPGHGHGAAGGEQLLAARDHAAHVRERDRPQLRVDGAAANLARAAALRGEQV